MKSFSKALIVCACSAAMMCGCSNGVNNSNASAELYKRNVLAISWMENSAEYRALCYQAYNGAYEHIKASLKQKSSKPRAIILDLDETVINNIPAEASINSVIKDGQSFNDSWLSWESMARADAMPGAVEFLKKVDKLGVDIFYVSNRSCRNVEFTNKNLKALKFPFKNAVKCKDNTSNKKVRFDNVMEKYNVVAFLGDNATDFPINIYGVSGDDRNKLVDKNSNQFGVKYFVLPNPVYGEWYSQIDPNLLKQSHKKMVELVDKSVKHEPVLKEAISK
ncbi:5'-nucleotidase, lipoprotein e(P4) family [Succinivibrio dextrinosolvens DSM 3072]|uniref:5'-nucleotidase, lipoprotein e(P4) family n=1 Tax=Succinivibrio dextrinosolvens DSM 3072 TaxID=1123324 RepID=A0A1T4VB59_9GAMM|nr:5'-nucleotidase, lipoprotein e(P4) family [Succinivibrio dextrinosolvens]SKA62133.1 5'-nucleotidase, lipoprotein e(P4) family [Succinivibrio dextrinosolvens DSM 3072]